MSSIYLTINHLQNHYMFLASV